MTAWTEDELARIGTADELQISPARSGGKPGRATTIWVVPDGDDLYVRAYRGRGGQWFQAATAAHEGRISAGGVTKDVTLAEVDEPALGDRLDAAYRAKYGHYGPDYVDPMVAETARAATLRLLPR
ncbi:DUF2255 family protein [Actinacidiphila paucisporea]|uniref:DUF2255 family protein n=1 Tax=Actinacidiphila paucisporea TaxID=310782 RepID=A0A1M7LZQ8_9ACTN|nr:DUF2255 family protein [Actinacidiphila paucisporea]SHM83851.1 hypothetical protein SAMN05216499_11533 [Actinacidiphila paucisporea]